MFAGFMWGLGASMGVGVVLVATAAIRDLVVWCINPRNYRADQAELDKQSLELLEDRNELTRKTISVLVRIADGLDTQSKGVNSG